MVKPRTCLPIHRIKEQKTISPEDSVDFDNEYHEIDIKDYMNMSGEII